MRTKTLLLLTLVATAVLVAGYQIALYLRETEPSGNVLSIWGVVFVLLLVFWIDIDSKDHPRIYRPFEYSYLVLLFLLPYAPYYFWRTRGAVGLLSLAGLMALLYLGDLLWWLIGTVR